MKLKYTYLSFATVLLLALLLGNHINNLFKHQSRSQGATRNFVDFFALIKKNTNTLYYNDKKNDVYQYFLIHNVLSPKKNIINYYRQIGKVDFDYYLIQDYYKVLNKEKFTGDTLLKKQFKDYSLYLLQSKKHK